MTEPQNVFIPRVNSSERALLSQLAAIETGGGWAQSATALPGWSRGHLLTHLARHADSLSIVLEKAAGGEFVQQYPGGSEQRAAEIEAGADRTVDALLADLGAASHRLLRAIAEFPDDRWQTPLLFRSGQRPAHQALVSRWREVEIHRVDLAIGYSPSDWPEEFVSFLLPIELERLPQRDASVSVPQGRTDAELLAWLLGRSQDPALPALPPWS